MLSHFFNHGHISQSTDHITFSNISMDPTIVSSKTSKYDIWNILKKKKKLVKVVGN